jgi:hypothetical protein
MPPQVTHLLQWLGSYRKQVVQKRLPIDLGSYEGTGKLFITFTFFTAWISGSLRIILVKILYGVFTPTTSTKYKL